MNIRTKAIKAFHSMNDRCDNNLNYVDYKVCDEWKNNQEAFIAWYIDNYKDGYQVDKDLLINTKKEYSPSTCLLVPAEINMAFRSKKSNSRGNSTSTITLPLGVSKSYNNKSHAYQSHCKIDGVQTHLGLFNSADAAHKAWQLAKIRQLQALANKYFEFNDAIQQRIKLIRNDIDNNVETKM